MNIAIISVTGRDVGGIMAFMARLANGVNKYKVHCCDIICLSRGNSLETNYRKQFNIPWNHIYTIGNIDVAVEFLNENYDYVVHENPGGYNDIRQYKSGKFPWYHQIIEKIKVPQCVVIHDPETWTKWCPYIDLYEQYCTHMFSNKTSLAETYKRERGVLEVHPLNIPIDTSPMKVAFLGKEKCIASTHRIFPMKRYHHIINAVKELPDWKLSITSNTSTYFYLKTIKQMVEDCPNIDLTTGSYNRNLWEIYSTAALVYSASKFPPGNEGGMENVAMEGVVYGAVPLVTSDWCGHPDSPPEEAVYKFTVYNEHGDSDLVHILKEIDPRSEDYRTRQRAVMDFVEMNKKDIVVAKEFLRVLRGYK